MVSPDSRTDPEQELLLADSIGLALLVVLNTLTPAERVAFVLLCPCPSWDSRPDLLAPHAGCSRAARHGHRSASVSVRQAPPRSATTALPVTSPDVHTSIRSIADTLIEQQSLRVERLHGQQPAATARTGAGTEARGGRVSRVDGLTGGSQ
jgi:hypothetical protein